jgi:DNA processing protein
VTGITELAPEELPERLQQVKPAIQLLYCNGDTTLLNRPTIAIIGTRQATDVGRVITYDLATALALQGWVIVAGLADGIDTVAHTGAVCVTGGKTIAVLGTPLDWKSMYPASNTRLAQRIAETGVLCTEYATDLYNPRRFIERDRIQAALADIVIPVQFPTGSGTRHTIAAAKTLQKEIWCLPVPEDDALRNAKVWSGNKRLMLDPTIRLFATIDKLLTTAKEHLAALQQG